MLSKILPFNKTLLRKDWHITKWFFYSYLILLIMAVPYNVARNLSKLNSNSYDTMNNLLYTLRRVLNLENELVIVALIIIPVALSVALIGEEKRKKTIEIMISGPFSRFEIFFNKIVLGIFILVVPILISGISLLIMRGTSDYVGMMFTSSQIMIWIFSYSAFAISMFSFSCIMGMLFGSSIGQFICTYIFGVFPIVFYEMFYLSYSSLYTLINGKELAYENAVRSVSKYFEMITPMQFFFRTFDYSQSAQIFFSFRLLAVAMGMLLIALVLFDLSKMEKNSEVLTFESLEGFFRLGVFLSSILAGGIIFSEMIELGTPGLFIGYVVGGFAGYKIPLYLIQKNRAS